MARRRALRSVRQLAQQHAVSISTAQQVYRLPGEPRRGRGATEVRLLRRAARAGAARTLLDLRMEAPSPSTWTRCCRSSSGSSTIRSPCRPSTPSRRARCCRVEAVAGADGGVNQRHPGNTPRAARWKAAPLRQEIARRAGPPGVTLRPRRDRRHQRRLEAVYLALLQLVAAAGDTIVLESPTYPPCCGRSRFWSMRASRSPAPARRHLAFEALELATRERRSEGLRAAAQLPESDRQPDAGGTQARAGAADTERRITLIESDITASSTLSSARRC